MDYKNVPNTTVYPPEPVDLNGGISSGTISPNAYVAATLQQGDDDPHKSHRGIIIGIIVLIGLMSFGGVGFFFYQNSQRAAASTNESNISTVVVEVSGSPIQPTPTYLLPSVAPSPTIDINASPTVPPPLIQVTETLPTPTPQRLAWEIVFEKLYYTSADVTNSIRPSFTGTLKSPFSRGVTICLAQDKIFFTRKKNAKTIERLCDDATPTPSNRTLNCYKYDPDTGIPVTASLYPSSNCSNPTSVPESTTYVMAATVYYNCSISGNQTSNVPESACRDQRDVFSYDLTYTQ